MIGRTISHYEILEQLGSGGMGVVYRARDVRLDRVVAIKLLSARLHADPDARARFVQEARAASALDHSNICTIFEIDETPEGQTFMVMAHYDGVTLEQRLDRGPLAIGEAVGIAAQIADGLAKAHAKGIVHRDIKPSNVMATRDGVMKILDFGLAKIAGMDGLTQTGTSLGTPAYMAPEQVAGGTVDHRADLWGLGALLHSLLSGRPPFQGDSMAAMLYAITHLEPQPLRAAREDAPAALDAIVQRCLRRNPEERYQDAAGLAADLRRVLRTLYPDETTLSAADTIPITVRTALFPSRTAGGHRKRLRHRMPLALALLVAGAGLAWFGISRVTNARGPVRVAVPLPEVAAAGDSTEATYVANAAQLAVVRGLSSLRGIGAIDPAEHSDTDGPALEVARSAAADEMVGVSLTSARNEWQVTMRRVLVADGTVRWADNFTVPQEPSLVLSDALVSRLRRAFPRHRPRPGVAAMKVSSEDYEEFLRLERAFNQRGAGAIGLDQVTERLETLARRSPTFLDAHLLVARVNRQRFTTTNDPQLLERAAQAAASARRLAPEDPRALSVQTLVALEGDSLDRVRNLLDDYRRVAPGDVGILVFDAVLAERAGRVAEAVALLKAAVARTPSRFHMEQLADLDYRSGRIADARRDLERLIERFPDSQFPHAKLAQLELLYGRPERAQALFIVLSERFPETNSYRTNLGLARMLLGNYAGAAAILRTAHQQRPKSIAALLNLADAEGLAGNRETARGLYRRALTLIEEGATVTRWDSRLRAAQCLAQTGRHEEALRAARSGLSSAPENSEALYMASLVYVLAGRRDSALTLSQRALDKGMQARWYRFAWFDPLRSDAGFARLVATQDLASPPAGPDH